MSTPKYFTIDQIVAGFLAWTTAQIEKPDDFVTTGPEATMNYALDQANALISFMPVPKEECGKNRMYSIFDGDATPTKVLHWADDVVGYLQSLEVGDTVEKIEVVAFSDKELDALPDAEY